MPYIFLKNFLKKFSFIWKLLTWVKGRLKNISRLIDVFLMMLALHFWPEQAYRFSTRKLLPGKKNRFSKKIKPEKWIQQYFVQETAYACMFYVLRLYL